MKKLLLILAIVLLPMQAHALVKTRISKTLNSVTQGLVAWWTFDANTVNTGKILDVSGNGNTLTNVSISTSTFYTSGIMGQAVNYDGDANSTLASDVLGTGPLTISVWVRYKTFGPDTSTMIIYGNSTRFRIENNGTRAVFSSDGLTTNCVGASINPQRYKWTNIIVTRNASNQCNIYVNGIQSGTANQASGTPTGSTAGKVCLSVTGSNKCNTAIDDLRIYNRVLTYPEIYELSQSGNMRIGVAPLSINNGLVGRWIMDGKNTVWSSDTAGTEIDASGNGFTGTLTTMEKRINVRAGKIGQGVYFDGVNDQITVADSNSLSFTNGTNDLPFTFSAWVKRGITATSTAIFAKVNTTVGSTPFEYVYYINSSDKLCVYLYGSTGATQINSCSTNSVAADKDKWTFYTATYSGSGANTGITLYRNAAPIAMTTGSAGSYTTMSNSSAPLRIGAGFSSDATISLRYMMLGQIDDARMYNRVLSQQEIYKLFVNGQVLLR